MTRSERTGRLQRMAFLAATALSLSFLAIGGEAAAKVGVTSATDGDPLGKPPSEAERVLRIGIDVQANELITTSANDRAHLVFLDGSSLTVGPNARLTIDRFVFDPNTKTGELAINASRGVLRMVGGRISKSSPITITTPSATIGIRGGITMLDVQAGRTASAFIFGRTMSVTAAGATENVTRPGSQVVTNLGARPGAPTLLPPGALSAQLAQLEGRSAPAGTPGASGSGTAARTVDRSIQGSGLSVVNSGQPARVVALRTGNSFGSGPGPRNRNPNDTVVTAITSAGETAATQQAERQAASQSTAQATTQVAPTGQPSGSSQPPSSTGEHQFETLDPGIIPTNASSFSPSDFRRLNIAPNSQISTIGELGMLQGTATYNGSALAFINGAGVVDGTYQNIWNFGARSGIATVRIDNTTYGGGTAANTILPANSQYFQSTNALPSTSGPQGRSLTLYGAFLSTPNRPANQQFGVIGITGPNNYNGVGLVAGTR